MSVFQRRLASSTYALMRSFERRQEKLAGLIDDIRNGRLTEEQLMRQQRGLDKLDDVFETRTADEDAASEDGGEQHEEFESKALSGTIAVNLSELEVERLTVEALFNKAQSLFNTSEESKFEKLREVLSDPQYPRREAHHLHRAPRHCGVFGAPTRRARLHRSSCPNPRRPTLPRARASSRIFSPTSIGRRG